MELYRLIYTSTRAADCDENCIKDILAACERKNPHVDITGVLVHSDSTFFQYLEGDKEELIKLYRIIEQDKRHTNCHMQKYESIDKKIFPSWNMGYKDMDSQLAEFDTEVKGKELIHLENLIYGSNELDDEGVERLRDQFKVAVV